jgi:Ras GTPase-activating-like protein IQGAP2/3
VILSFQELDHSKDMVSRALIDSRTPEEVKQGQPMMEDAHLPLEQKKRKIQRNLRTLEQTGHVSSKNKYQDILNEITKVSAHSTLSSLLSRHYLA